MKLALVVLLAVALAAGLLWVLQPWSGGVELVYALQFPPGFAGDREEAAGETLSRIQVRLAGIEPVWNSRAFPDGRFRIRFRDLKDVASVRRVIEKPARILVQAKGKTILETRDFSGAVAVPPDAAGRWGVKLDLSKKAAETLDSVEDALVIFVLDGEPFGVPVYGHDKFGSFLIFYGAPSEQIAEEWAMSIRAPPYPFPLGTPDVGRYRGELKP